MEDKAGETAVRAATSASAQTNLGAQKPEAGFPFVMTKVATFHRHGASITEKVGPIRLGTQRSEAALIRLYTFAKEAEGAPRSTGGQ